MAELARSGRNGSGLRKALTVFRMIAQPLLGCLPIMVVYHWMVVKGIHSSPRSDSPITNAILPIIAGGHFILAAFLMTAESNDFIPLRRAVRQMDKGAFMDVAASRIAWQVKFLLFATGAITNGWTMSLVYYDYWTGFMAVFSVAYVVALIWEVVVDLDDPVNGIWVIEAIPPDWAAELGLRKRWSDIAWERFINLFG